jgi:hypothetical protein
MINMLNNESPVHSSFEQHAKWQRCCARRQIRHEQHREVDIGGAYGRQLVLRLLRA